MSLLDRDEVQEPKSLASTKPTDRPRVAASSATPAPTTPPPTTKTCGSSRASAVSAVVRSSGPSLLVPPVITVKSYPPGPTLPISSRVNMASGGPGAPGGQVGPLPGVRRDGTSD